MFFLSIEIRKFKTQGMRKNFNSLCAVLMCVYYSIVTIILLKTITTTINVYFSFRDSLTIDFRQKKIQILKLYVR